MNRHAIFECCVDSITSALSSLEGGAMRLEICSALNEGGLTPSIGLFRQIQRNAPEQYLCVLIRPRCGDFVYSEDELAVMVEDIKLFKQSGANGIVVGALTREGDLDVDAMRKLITATDGSMEVTFHRAIDVSRRPIEVLQRCKELGVRRVLTSGCAPSAHEGLLMLKRFSHWADSEYPAESRTDFIVAAAGAVSEINAVEILREGVDQLHASLRNEVKTDCLVVITETNEENGTKRTKIDLSPHFGKVHVTPKARVERILASIAWREEVGTNHATEGIQDSEKR